VDGQLNDSQVFFGGLWNSILKRLVGLYVFGAGDSAPREITEANKHFDILFINYAVPV
jgi:hypothetical protein